METNNFDVLNSMVDSIAIIDSTGKIVFTNSAWKQFSLENAGIEKKTGPNVNYLNSSNPEIGNVLDNAKEAELGISAVINRKELIFELEYPCHSPKAQRWFLL